MRAEFHSISSISGILSVLMDFQPKFKVLSIQSTLVLFKSSDILTLLTMMISEVTLTLSLSICFPKLLFKKGPRNPSTPLNPLILGIDNFPNVPVSQS